MMRCVRFWTNNEGLSEFEEGMIALQPGRTDSLVSEKIQVITSFFEETAAASKPTWHTPPNRQSMVNLGGTLELQTANERR